MRILIILLLVLILTGCSNSIRGKYTEVRTVVSEDVGNSSVVFCPRENCSNALAEFILSAEEYVYCAFFDLDLEDVIDALKEKSKKIDVKVVVDKDNYELVDDLKFVKHDTRSAFMHNKFCVKDDLWISSGSFNPTDNGANLNNNNLIFIKSKYLASNYKDEFTELWNGEFGKGDNVRYPIINIGDSKVKNWFCPEDFCGDKIEEELKKAQNNIYFMVFSFTHNGIANELLMKNEDIDVKGIFEKRGSSTEYSKFNVMDYQEADVRKDNNSYAMHHKVFIIDNNIVITGSFNPSKNADTNNDENILIISDKEIF